MEQAFIIKDHPRPVEWGAHIACCDSPDELSVTCQLCWLSTQHPQWKSVASRLATLGIPTVLISHMLDIKEMQLAFTVGVKGYCSHTVSQRTADTIAATVTQAGLWVPDILLSRMVGNLAMLAEYQPKAASRQQDGLLTEREKTVTNLILEGQSNLEIAQQLAITERTVKQHISAILRKYNARDRVGLLLKLGEFTKLT